LLISAGAIAQVAYISGHCNEHECSICGKSISEWDDSPDHGLYMPSGSIGFCSNPSATYFYQETRHICQECREKHQEEYSTLIDGFYDRLRKDNQVLIKQYEQERKEKRIQKINEEIKRLKENLEREK
jgi:hypothetical protein